MKNGLKMELCLLENVLQGLKVGPASQASAQRTATFRLACLNGPASLRRSFSPHLVYSLLVS